MKFWGAAWLTKIAYYCLLKFPVSLFDFHHCLYFFHSEECDLKEKQFFEIFQFFIGTEGAPRLPMYTWRWKTYNWPKDNITHRLDYKGKKVKISASLHKSMSARQGASWPWRKTPSKTTSSPIFVSKAPLRIHPQPHWDVDEGGRSHLQPQAGSPIHAMQGILPCKLNYRSLPLSATFTAF